MLSASVGSLSCESEAQGSTRDHSGGVPLVELSHCSRGPCPEQNSHEDAQADSFKGFTNAHTEVLYGTFYLIQAIEQTNRNGYKSETKCRPV